MIPGQTRRFVSRLTRNTLALILAGGRGSRLKHLTLWRAKPAVPFGGKFRIIDFPLSNCLNSGIRSIGVLSQYKAHSLIQHIHRGWNFLRGEFGEFVELLPAQQRIETSWYEGTADAVYQNLDIIRNHHPDFVLILAGDHIYKMDYGPMIADHVERGADMTVGCIEVPLEEARSFGVMSVDADNRVTEFQEKPASPQPMPGYPDRALASMGIYVFNTDFLYRQLIRTPTMRPRRTISARTSFPRSSRGIKCSPIRFATSKPASRHTGAMWVPSMPSGRPTWSSSA
jgi:glucose-1-phosphate adenylyltransferase